MPPGKTTKEARNSLAKQEYFVHQINFDDQGKQTTNLGEPGKSAPGQDNMSPGESSRVCVPRSAAELYLATNQESYRIDFERYFKAWIRDFYDPTNAGFFIHANVTDHSDHKEMGPFKNPGGVDSGYDGLRGVKGNDGTIYALSSVLLQANDVLANEQTQNLIERATGYHPRKTSSAKRHALGELYQRLEADLGGLAESAHGSTRRTQDEPRSNRWPAMAPQQIIEGARQLHRQKRSAKRVRLVHGKH